MKFINKKILLIPILLIILLISGCGTAPTPSTIVITRLATNLDDGQLFVHLDGKVINKKQPIGKGQTRTIPISNGNHRIIVKVDNFQSDPIVFSADNNTTNFVVSAQRIGGSRALILERKD